LHKTNKLWLRVKELSLKRSVLVKEELDVCVKLAVQNVKKLVNTEGKEGKILSS